MTFVVFGLFPVSQPKALSDDKQLSGVQEEIEGSRYEMKLRGRQRTFGWCTVISGVKGESGQVSPQGKSQHAIGLNEPKTSEVSGIAPVNSLGR